ncbi:MAG: ATP synthase F1 subunit gamma [Muribaculaceae bacterium]|nr:ATP synthase F1 subunit gamma [Muribaculaceae bacterium]
MATLRELKGRIGSVASSEKITGAMKMISSAKMHKAEGALRQLKPYREQVETIIANLLGSDASFDSPLMTPRDTVSNYAVVVWGSDDGLCGAYNMNIFKQLVSHLAGLREKYGDTVHITVIPVGAKIAKAAAKIKVGGVNVKLPEDVDSKTTEVKDFTWRLRDSFLNGEYDVIDVLYMSYKSVSRQRLETSQLLPVTAGSFADLDSEIKPRPYIFEPSAEVIFNKVLPMYLLAVIQDVFTENRASEQAARVMAMQSANDNAKKLFDQLQLEFNKLRQQAITTELLDILGGQVK